MSDPLGLINGGGQYPVGFRPGLTGAQGGAAPAVPGGTFRDVLLDNIEQVNKLEQEANHAMEDLVANKRDDLEGVLSATQKADTAFRLLLSVRNKVTQAYEEIKQMRV